MRCPLPPSRNPSSLPLLASHFKFNNGDQSLTQSDSLFSLLNYFYLISTFGNLHAMTSAPPFLSPPSPCFLDVTASRSCACWILPAPTHQLSTSPLPAGVSPAFSEIHWGLDTPAVGSLVICCLPHTHIMDACGSGETVGRYPHH